MTIRHNSPEGGLSIEGPEFLLEVTPLPNRDWPRAPAGIYISHGGDGDPAVLDPEDAEVLRDWLTAWLDWLGR